MDRNDSHTVTCLCHNQRFTDTTRGSSTFGWQYFQMDRNGLYDKGFKCAADWDTRGLTGPDLLGKVIMTSEPYTMPTPVSRDTWNAIQLTY